MAVDAIVLDIVPPSELPHLLHALAERRLLRPTWAETRTSRGERQPSSPGYVLVDGDQTLTALADGELAPGPDESADLRPQSTLRGPELLSDALRLPVLPDLVGASEITCETNNRWLTGRGLPTSIFWITSRPDGSVSTGEDPLDDEVAPT